MSVDSALVAGRRAAAARMTSTCNVRRKTGATTTVSSLEVPVWETVHEGLPLRLAGTSGGASPSAAQALGGNSAQAARREAHLPYDTTDLADGDLIEVTAGENVGLVLRVIEADGADQQTARRIPVEATRRPAEWV